MSTGGFTFFHLILALFIYSLSACSSSGSVALTDTISPTEQQSEDKVKQLSRVQFNLALERDLNEQNLSSLQSKVDVLSIAQHLRQLQPEQYTNPLVTAKTAADLKQELVYGMLELSQLFTWKYLNTETFADHTMAAYFRIDNDAGYSYITLWVDDESFKVFDFHPISFQFSALTFIGEFTQLFNKYNDRQTQLSLILFAVQLNDWDELVKLYTVLDADIKAEPALNDFLLRQYGQFQGESPSFKKMLISTFEQQGMSSLLFEPHYIQQDNFSQAIKMVESLPPFARNDSKILSELAILHAYNQNFTQAVFYGRQAIQAEPDANEMYIVLLQVSLLAKNYDLSIELLDVLTNKFDFAMSKALILEFDEGDNFLRSDEYHQWLQRHSAS